jgi:nifR3 family TIM-barrel protein
MEGVSHAEFRQIMVERGELHLVCTEFVRITSAPAQPKRLREEVKKAPGCALSVQVMGNLASQMAEAAAIVADAGADVVDINLGCPMPRVVRKGVGAAMLKNPKLLEEVLCQMRKSTPVLLSAKIRAGFDDSANVVETARLIEGCGVDFIAVHPRRRCDFYQGTADWRIIGALKQALKIPVVGNGDVWYAEDALRMQAETGCDAVMIGRPALRNPWIFRQIAELRAGLTPFTPNGNDLARHLHHVFARYLEAFPKVKLGPLGPLKELLSWTGRAVPDAGAFMKAALRMDDSARILEHVDRVLTPLSAEQLDLQASGHLKLERSGSAVLAPAFNSEPRRYDPSHASSTRGAPTLETCA